jgi:hypothetical protein
MALTFKYLATESNNRLVTADGDYLVAYGQFERAERRGHRSNRAGNLYNRKNGGLYNRK